MIVLTDDYRVYQAYVARSWSAVYIHDMSGISEITEQRLVPDTVPDNTNRIWLSLIGYVPFKVYTRLAKIHPAPYILNGVAARVEHPYKPSCWYAYRLLSESQNRYRFYVPAPNASVSNIPTGTPTDTPTELTFAEPDFAESDFAGPDFAERRRSICRRLSWRGFDVARYDPETDRVSLPNDIRDIPVISLIIRQYYRDMGRKLRRIEL